SLQRRRHRLLAHHANPHLLRVELLAREPHFSGGGPRGLVLLAPGAAEQERERALHRRPTTASSRNSDSQKSWTSLRYSAYVSAQVRWASSSSRSDAAPFSY